MRLWIIEETTQLIRPLQVTQPQFYSPDDENFFVLFLSLTFCFSSDDSVTFDSPFFYGWQILAFRLGAMQLFSRPLLRPSIKFYLSCATGMYNFIIPLHIQPIWTPKVKLTVVNFFIWKPISFSYTPINSSLKVVSNVIWVRLDTVNSSAAIRRKSPWKWLMMGAFSPSLRSNTSPDGLGPKSEIVERFEDYRKMQSWKSAPNSLKVDLRVVNLMPLLHFQRATRWLAAFCFDCRWAGRRKSRGCSLTNRVYGF